MRYPFRRPVFNILPLFQAPLPTHFRVETNMSLSWYLLESLLCIPRARHPYASLNVLNERSSQVNLVSEIKFVRQSLKHLVISHVDLVRGRDVIRGISPTRIRNCLSCLDSKFSAARSGSNSPISFQIHELPEPSCLYLIPQPYRWMIFSLEAIGFVVTKSSQVLRSCSRPRSGRPLTSTCDSRARQFVPSFVRHPHASVRPVSDQSTEVTGKDISFLQPISTCQ